MMYLNMLFNMHSEAHPYVHIYVHYVKHLQNKRGLKCHTARTTAAADGSCPINNIILLCYYYVVHLHFSFNPITLDDYNVI